MKYTSVGACSLIFTSLLVSCDGNISGTVSESKTAISASAEYDWLQFGGSAAHTSNNTLETQLTAANVNGLRRLFQVRLPAPVDNAPVVLTNVVAGGAARDLVFVTTKAGDLLAIDARSGTTVWKQSHGAGGCKINNGSSTCYTTSSPAIDPGRGFVYSYGLDGRVHKHAVADGSEVTSGGWPELTTTKPFDEKSSPALGFATVKSGHTYLYVGNGGYPGDRGDYQGHVTAIDLGDGSQRVFNTLCSTAAVHFVEKPGSPDCSEVQAAVWGRAGAVYDAALDRIFFATGNGTFNPSQSNWGDTILALTPDGSALVDTYTPTNFQALDDNDADLGSTEPLILPSVANSRVANLALQSGKDAKLRLVSLANLSGQGGTGHTGGELALVDVPQGSEVLTAPAAWSDAHGVVWVFVANDSGLSALTVTADGAGNPTLTTKWQHRGQRTSPLVANNVLYAAGPNVIEALDPTTGNRLWSDGTIGGSHWASPTVANGVVYIADTAGNFTAYALATGTTLPPPWRDADVGAVGHTGSASFAGGTFSISASGTDIWGTADAFHFVYQPLVGDGQITARVTAESATNAWTKAGVMIRESLAANARHAVMVLTPGHGAAFQRRVTVGGASAHTVGPSVSAPYWVRVARAGNTLTGSVSADGMTWTTVGTATIALPSSVLMGMALTAHDNTNVATASFSGL
jgi:hypothetical protein